MSDGPVCWTDEDIDTTLALLRVLADGQVRTNALLERIAVAVEPKRKPKQASLVPELTPREKVEALELDADLIAWGKDKCPSVQMGLELEAFKDRMRANGYKVGRLAVQDARRAFQTSCRNAEAWGTYRNGKGGNPPPGGTFKTVEKRQ